MSGVGCGEGGLDSGNNGTGKVSRGNESVMVSMVVG